ncbi:MAG: hypothetical protein R3253_08645 [Longimicrobiales bacterium]|nr:hypothetical protein [Longimicrobiales bacterium]
MVDVVGQDPDGVDAGCPGGGRGVGRGAGGGEAGEGQCRGGPKERAPGAIVPPGRAKTLLRRYEDQALSFTDCTSFVVMRELALDGALTSDEHFRMAGFELVLDQRAS